MRHRPVSGVEEKAVGKRVECVNGVVAGEFGRAAGFVLLGAATHK
jgi:hypothetical protein